MNGRRITKVSRWYVELPDGTQKHMRNPQDAISFINSQGFVLFVEPPCAGKKEYGVKTADGIQSFYLVRKE